MTSPFRLAFSMLWMSGRFGDQLLKVQTPHRVTFSEGEACCVHFTEPMWYPADDEEAEKERARRQLV